MQIARNHKAIVIHPENINELEKIIEALRVLTNPMFHVPAFIGDDERKFKINSLKGLVISIRLEDFEEIK